MGSVGAQAPYPRNSIERRGKEEGEEKERRGKEEGEGR